MSQVCTRCDGSGFLNIHQVPTDVVEKGVETVRLWMDEQDDPHDVQVCDCCGDEYGWYGTPGEHYNDEDPMGFFGPYAYNGGLCECH
jgi:hypothetical protein